VIHTPGGDPVAGHTLRMGDKALSEVLERVDALAGTVRDATSPVI
jgi:hypothetical protein